MITKKKLRAEIEELKRELELKESERSILSDALGKARVENMRLREMLDAAPICNTTYIKTTDYKTKDLIQRVIVDANYPEDRKWEIKGMIADGFADELIKKELLEIEEDIDPVKKERIFTAILRILI